MGTKTHEVPWVFVIFARFPPTVIHRPGTVFAKVVSTIATVRCHAVDWGADMRRIIKGAVCITIAALTLGACASMRVGSHVRPDLTPAVYRTFDWGPADALPTGDPRLDANPAFHDYLQGAVTRTLETKGIVRATAAPDLLIHYHANVTQRIDVNRLDDQYGYCFDDDCRVRTRQFEAGTIVLDVVDPRTNKVIWRGWAQDDLARFLDNPRDLGRTIRTAVSRMLERYPTGH